MELGGKNILVIGSNSFLAARLISKLKDEYSILGVFNSATDLHHTDVSHINITELADLEDRFDVVYLISAYLPYRTIPDNKRLFEVNVELVEKVVNKFKKAHVVFASSVSVYGESVQEINENTPSLNANSYGLSKLWAESIIKQHPSYSIHRISSMYGVNMKMNTFLPLIIKDALGSGKITIGGEGARKQNYINVNDVAESMIKSAIQPFNEVFLSTDERSYSNLEVAKLVKDLVPGTTIEFKGNDNSLSYIYNSKLTYQKLDWNPGVSLEHGVKELIEWIKREY